MWPALGNVIMKVSKAWSTHTSAMTKVFVDTRLPMPG